MAIVTTYTCDKCGHSQDKYDQMWHIGININHCDSRYGSRGNIRSEIWCRTCIEDVGLLPYTTERKKETKYAEPPATLEQLIRSLVRSEAEGV